MTERIMGPQGSKRRRRFLWVPIAAAVSVALFMITGAQAVHDIGLFELDPNDCLGLGQGVHGEGLLLSRLRASISPLPSDVEAWGCRGV